MGKRWYATICCRVNEEHTVHNGHAIGGDRNVGQVADSDGEISRMHDVSRLEAKLRRHRLRLSRTRKGSKRRECAQGKVTRAARHLANACKAWRPALKSSDPESRAPEDSQQRLGAVDWRRRFTARFGFDLRT